MQTLHRLRRFRDLRAVSSGAGPPPTASPVRCACASDQEARLPLPNLPGQPSRLDCAPLSLSPSLELAPRAGRFREVVRASGRSGSACPESGTGCRIGFAALRLSGKPWPILAMAPRITGSMPPACRRGCMSACLRGGLLARMASRRRLPVCLSACLHVWQSACPCPSPDR
jgi:hypothetical protein